MTMNAYPFVKWAGGKRQLLAAILGHLPSSIKTYYEPFVGGGAVFFHLSREGAYDRAVLSDTNPDLANVYRVLSHPEKTDAIIDLLSTYIYDREFYLEIRAKVPSDLTDVEAAARMLYLNRVGFNGLYRVNKKGLFNVPFGRYTNPTICNEANLREVSKVLSGVTFTQADFELACQAAQPGDVVYLDPPYLPLSATSAFTEYTAGGFGVQEHHRLARQFAELADRGVFALLSNSDCPLVWDMYSKFPVYQVPAKRSINSKGTSRGHVGELLIRTF